jgi:hypothetical protein
MSDPRETEKKTIDEQLSADLEDVDRTISQTDVDPGDDETDRTISQTD